MGASGATTEVLAQAAGSASSSLARLEATTTDVDQRATVGCSIDQEMARATSQFDSDRRVNQPQAQAIEKQLQVLKSTGNAVAAQQAGLHAMERQSSTASHLLQSFLRRQQDASERGQLGQADARVFTLATPPERASSLHPIFLLPVREIPT
ncbi:MULTISPECIES: hypothetical protein [unclassified Mesorhizobium]|uniref:hypothetical protein n=1 Tax=unclassified Mesorhizobium TaxID=325217 RepID=UPI00040E4A8B|nr:hypothetical protein [Mesorhizobium sp. LSHC420B00]